MTRDDFLNELSSRLSHISAQERENVLNYYLEYFEERGVTATGQVPLDMASPQKIADEILHDIPFTQREAAGNAGSQNMEFIPMDHLEELDVKLNLGSLEIELADIPSVQLIRPKTPSGISIDYELTFRVEGTKLFIRDKLKDNWFSSRRRIELDPVVLKIPNGTGLRHALINLKMGSTKIYGLTVDRLELKNKMGSIVLRDSVAGYLDADLDMGSIKVENSVIHGSAIKVSMGDLRGKARLLGYHKLVCSMGSIKLSLDQARAATSLQSQVSMGSFRVNGEKSFGMGTGKQGAGHTDAGFGTAGAAGAAGATYGTASAGAGSPSGSEAGFGAGRQGETGPGAGFASNGGPQNAPIETTLDMRVSMGSISLDFKR